jgi:type II secretory pathway pseudopilin PulG
MQIRGSGVLEYWSDGVMDKNAESHSLLAKQLLSPPSLDFPRDREHVERLVGGDKGEGARERGFSACRTGLASARSTAGFTIIELLIAIALGMVILAGLFRTFKVQHDSYIIQDQVSAMQQNLRAAMYMITRDLQMAGYYTNFDRNNRQLDWNDLDSDSDPTNNMETGRPLLFAVNNASVSGIKSGTDIITIVKADNDSTASRAVNGSATGTSINVGWDLGGSKFGLLVKGDLSFADLIWNDSGTWKPAGTSSLSESYASGDTVFRTDLIIYRVRADAEHPCLERKNLGKGETTYQTIAENIDNLQFRYLLDDGTPNGTWTNAPVGNDQRRVRAVEVLLVARTAFAQRGYRDSNSIAFGDYTIPAPADAYRRKMLTSIVKTRNIGL